MNGYNTTEEKSVQWGVTSKTIQNFCRHGKIDGVIKRAGAWFIPDDTPNPLKNSKPNAVPIDFVGTKKKIFDNAITLFMKNGYENASVKDIADSVGIRQSAVYNHFPSKQSILETCYDFYSSHYISSRPVMEDILPILQKGSTLEIIKSVLYEYKGEYIRQKMIEITILLVQRQVIDEQARNLINSLLLEEGMKFTESVLNKAVEIGRLVPFDTHTIALLINVVRLYNLQVSIIDSSPERLEVMRKEEQAVYELAAGHLTDLKQFTKTE